MEWADLQLVDMSEAQTVEGRLKLAPAIRDAMAKTGFFYVVNHGYTPEKVGYPFVLNYISLILFRPQEFLTLPTFLLIKLVLERSSFMKDSPRKLGHTKDTSLVLIGWVLFAKVHN